jgi:Tol biopolymer transport system component
VGRQFALLILVLLLPAGASANPRDEDLIAFLSSSGLEVVQPDGSARRVLDPGLVRTASLAWSPNGERLAYLRLAGEKPGLFAVRADGSGRTLLARGRGYRVSWAPNGRLIAAGLKRGPHFFPTEGAIVPAAGGTARPLRVVGLPSWSPDSNRLAYEVSPHDFFCRSCTPGIYTMTTRGTDRRRLTDPRRGIASAPTWSRDGRKILFLSATLHATTLYAIRIGRRGRQALARGIARGDSRREIRYAVSPDGSRIAWVLRGGAGIHVIRADGSGKRVLASELIVDSLSWSPDSRRIAFDAFQQCCLVSHIYVVSVDTTQVAQITGPDGSQTAPAWRPARR